MARVLPRSGKAKIAAAGGRAGLGADQRAGPRPLPRLDDRRSTRPPGCRSTPTTSARPPGRRGRRACPTPTAATRPRCCAGRCGAARGRDPVTRAMVGDVLTYLPGDLLVKVDMASMAHSLECRGPFLDHRVVELAPAMPLDRKLRLRPGRSKVVLKRAFADLLPGPIRTRRKMGFGVPVDRWFRDELRAELSEILLDPIDPRSRPVPPRSRPDPCRRPRRRPPRARQPPLGPGDAGTLAAELRGFGQLGRSFPGSLFPKHRQQNRGSCV